MTFEEQVEVYDGLMATIAEVRQAMVGVENARDDFLRGIVGVKVGDVVKDGVNTYRVTRVSVAYVTPLESSRTFRRPQVWGFKLTKAGGWGTRECIVGFQWRVVEEAVDA